MYLKSIAYLLGIFSFSLTAQNLTLSGKVIDTNNSPVPYANIILLMDADSTVLNGTASDENGFFKIDNLKIGSYQLKITYLGYKPYIQNIQFDGSSEIGTAHVSTP